jgi:RNA polymerase sigma factor (sigma-70 family)
MSLRINDLYNEARAGDDTAERQLFELLLDRFQLFAHQKVWSRQDAEDIVQNALVTVSTEYRDLEITSSFAAWAHKVLENKFLAYLKTKRRQQGRGVDLDSTDFEPADWTPDPSLKRRLLDCLKKVGQGSRRYARILNLHHLGFSRDEVCERLSMSRDQTYVVMSRARSRLKDCLDNGDRIK